MTLSRELPARRAIAPFDIAKLPWGAETSLQARLDALERYAESVLDVAHSS